MTKRRTDGERIAETRREWLRGEFFFPQDLAARIDRIIRKRQREAWIAGYNFRDVIAEMDKEDAP